MPRFRFEFRVALLLSLAIAFAAPPAGHAQLPDTKDLDKAYRESSQRWNKLLTGEESPGKADAQVPMDFAKWYLMRIATKQTNDVDEAARWSAKVHKEFNNVVNLAMRPAYEKANRGFVNKLGPALVATMKELLAANDPRTQPRIAVNSAMMFSTMARLRQIDITDYLVQVVHDEKNTHDVIRLYAIKALRDSMPIWQQRDPDPMAARNEDFDSPVQNAVRAHDTKLVDGLVKYIERPIDLKGKSPGEIEAVRFLRREAIKALAQAGAPAVNAIDKPQKLAGQVAPTLLRVLADGVLEPAPSLSEKVEAALGLCEMKYPNMKEYNPQVSIYLVGRTIEQFMKEYNKDWAKFTLTGEGRRLPYLAWKHDSRRLMASLDEMAKNAKDADVQKNVSLLKKNADAVLSRTAVWDQPSPANQSNLTKVIPQLAPKYGNVWKKLKAAPIPLK